MLLVDLTPFKDAYLLVYLSDGLYGGPNEQSDSPPVLFESDPFNNNWSCSVFTSMDPIALDSVIFDFLRNEPNVPLASEGCVDNCLLKILLNLFPQIFMRHLRLPALLQVQFTIHQGTKITLSRNQLLSGAVLSSLGVHEHWNDNINKQYTKNLGTGEGIELVRVY